MSIYDVNFDQCVQELYPTHKRLDVLLKKMYSIIKPVNELNLMFKYFREGGTFAAYNPVTVYTFGQYVQYQRRIYYRNEVTEDYGAGIYPLDSKYWTLILNSFIGSDERVKFGPSKIVLEYALNKIFGTTFNNPPATSEIYIQNLNTTDSLFFVGEIDSVTSTISQSDQDALYLIPQVETVETYDYAIYIPVAVWTALAATPTERDSIVTSVANQYRLVGYTFKIITY